jgi:ribosomal protein RSM22 (predicted rRNA methylase)
MIARLPEAIARAIDAEIAGVPATALRAAADALSRAYRGEQPRASLSPAERAAYLAVRLPSTFAAAEIVWRELAQAIPAARLRSVLDVGAGPGTVSLAARALLDAATEYTLLERDRGWRDVAARLADAVSMKQRFHHGAMTSAVDYEPHDAVVASYALGELAEGERARIADALWRASRQVLIVIEPGTPKGFALVRDVRAMILAQGGHAAAPCTHDTVCPMSERDWCHRPVRVARSRVHRAAKQAPLAYEDEKCSYVILTREAPARPAAARIVRKPIQASGHVHLDLCNERGLKRATFARSDGALYRQARAAEWGEQWPPYDDG